MHKVKIVCRAIIKDDQGRLLLTKKTGSDFWSLPGGKLDTEDASVQDCLLRELKEELGIDVRLGPVEFIQELHKDDTRYIEPVWQAVMTHPEQLPPLEKISIISSGELSHMDWFTKEDLAKVDVKPVLLKELDF